MTTLSYDARAKVDPLRAYQAVSTQEGFRDWWNRNAEVDSRVGGEARFEFGSSFWVFRFDELKPELVKMTCVRTNLDKWLGSILEFQIQPLGDGEAEVRLRHYNWPEGAELAVTQENWNRYGRSLQRYLESGVGTPYPDA